MIQYQPTRAELEQIKYQDIWQHKIYNEFSPGEKYAKIFSEMATKPDAAVLDIGAGAGRGGLALREMGYDVTFLDIADVNNLEPLIQAPIWSDWPSKRPKNFTYGYCCDMLEHIPTEYVGLSITRIQEACNETFFSVGLSIDSYGDLIKDTLHLTVRPYLWWREFLKEFGTVTDARDLGQTGIYWLSK